MISCLRMSSAAQLLLRTLGIFVFVCLISLVLARPAAAQAVTDADLYRLGYRAYNQQDWAQSATYLYAYVLRNPARYRNEAQHRKQVDAALHYAETQIESALQCIAPTAGVSTYYIISSSSFDFTPAPIEPGPSFPLVCRGGGEIEMAYSPTSFLSDKPQIWISFSPAEEGVGLELENAATLQPGQCSWLDRPISPDEPAQFVILAPLLEPNLFSISWSPSKIAQTGFALPFLNALEDSEQLQEFSVFNDNQGEFIATAIASESAPFPGDPEAIPQLAAPDALSSAPEPAPSEAIFDDDPRNNQRGQEPYFCSGCMSDCEFGACGKDQRVVWGPHCREGDHEYIQPGTYRAVVEGTGTVDLGATDYGATGELFAFGSQWAALPAEFTFCWPGRQADGYGFETIVMARETGVSVDHIRIEYLGDACVGG